jgi:hypothetical protein
MRISSAILVGLFAFSRAADAQTCPVNASPFHCTVGVSASATVNRVAQLSITTTTTTLTTPKSTDFGKAAGVNTTGPTVTVKTNTGYALTASATGWTGTGNTSKPLSDLKMSVSVNGGAAGALTALGTVGTSSSGTASTTYAIGYNTIYNWTVDKPGSYSLVVKYSLTAP